MTQAKEYKEYPPHTIKTTGIKVAWINLETLELAKEASKIALHNAEIAMDRGYDFGYQYPSTITKEDDGTYTVCIP